MLNDRCKWGIYVIIDAHLAQRPHIEIAKEVIAGGARVLQLRDKHLCRAELLPIAKELRSLTRDAHTTFIINDDPVLAAEVDADGVHVGQEDLDVVQVRKIIGHEKIVGLSTHSLQQAMEASRLPVDYIGVGPIFPTTTKENPWPVVGVDLVRQVRQQVPLVITAIGGIRECNIPQLVVAGAHNIAMIGEVMQAPNIRDKVRQLCAVYVTAKAALEDKGQ